MFKVNDKNTRSSGVFTVNFENLSVFSNVSIVLNM